MQLDLHAFARLRPYLYHVTAFENLASIRHSGRLEPATSLMRRAGRGDLVRWRRPYPVTLQVDDASVILRDQALLVEEQVSLHRDWSFADFIEYMNDHVYFWPGTDRGPVKSGIELAYRDTSASALTLRTPFDDLLDANPSAEPLFSSVNSGAMREPGSRRVGRGPHLFRSALHFSRRASDVVEVAFRSAVELPSSALYSDGSEWARL